MKSFKALVPALALAALSGCSEQAPSAPKPATQKRVESITTENHDQAASSLSTHPTAEELVEQLGLNAWQKAELDGKRLCGEGNMEGMYWYTRALVAIEEDIAAAKAVHDTREVLRLEEEYERVKDLRYSVYKTCDDEHVQLAMHHIRRARAEPIRVPDGRHREDPLAKRAAGKNGFDDIFPGAVILEEAPREAAPEDALDCGNGTVEEEKDLTLPDVSPFRR